MRTALLLALAIGCTRPPHARPTFGQANHATFDRQAQAAHAGAAQGLDSEEAAAIRQRYRQTLGGQRGAQPNDRGSSVLILDGGNHDAKKP